MAKPPDDRQRDLLRLEAIIDLGHPLVRWRARSSAMPLAVNVDGVVEFGWTDDGQEPRL